MPPGIPPLNSGGGSIGSGGGESAGNDTMGGVGYFQGGPVRPRQQRRLRRRRMLRPPPPPPGARPMPNRHRRRMMRRRMRRRPTGYAQGGPVNPLLMSTSLDSRSDNPVHYAEDREALATRPADAPSAPDDYGYEQGGEVFDTEDDDDDDDDAEWDKLEKVDVDDDEEELEPGGHTLVGGPDEFPEEPEEPPPEQAAPAGEDEEAAPEDQAAAPEGTAEQQAQPEEAGGGGGGGGGGSQGAQPKTGYGQDPDQPEQPEAPQDTGFDQSQAAPVSAPLKDVLDYTRKQLGIEGPKQAEAPAEQPAAPAADQQRNAAAAATAQVADASGQTGAAPQDPGETTPPQPPAESAATPEQQPRIPTPPRQAAAPQPSGTASGPGNKQAIADYMSGKGGYTPEQMTELLDRTNQTNPNLGQDGAIHQAFKELVDKKDIDGASKFVQALRPSYDNVRALMIAASSKGDFDTAMQLAERLNKLIPNGDQARFTQLPDGRVLATIEPEGGGPATQHAMTKEQFARYANSPLSLFDHVADQGLDKNFQMLTGQPGQQTNLGAQYAQNTAGTASDAGPMRPGRDAARTLADARAATAEQAGQVPLPRPRPTGAPGGQPPDSDVGESEWMRKRGATVHPSGYDPSGAPAYSSRRVPGYGPMIREQMGDPAFYDPKYKYPGGQQPVYPTKVGDRTISAEQAAGARAARPDIGAPAGDRYGTGYAAQPLDRPQPQQRVAETTGQAPQQAPAGQPRPAQSGQVQIEPKPLPTGYQPRLLNNPQGQSILDQHAQTPAGAQQAAGAERQKQEAAAQRGQPGQPGQPQQGQPQQDEARRAWDLVQSTPQRPTQQGQPQQGQPQQGQPQQGQPQQGQPGQLQRPPPMGQAPQPQGKQESPAMRKWKLDYAAWEAFPYDTPQQNLARGRYRERLELQERRSGAGGGGDKMAIEQGKQDNQNYRNDTRNQTARDINWLNNVTRMQSTAVRAQAHELAVRRAAWEKNPLNADKPFPMTEEDTKFISDLRKLTAPGGVDYTQRGTPPPGGQRPTAPPAAVPQQPAPPAAKPQGAPAAAPGQSPRPTFPGVDLEKYRHPTNPPGQLTPEQKQNWRWYHTEDGEWTLGPRKMPDAPAAPATPAPPPAPRSQRMDPSVTGMP
jgi:hypothetical protein